MEKVARRGGKAQQQQSRFRSLREEELQGPPSRTRASLKRRLNEPSSTMHQVEKKLNHEDPSRNGDQTHVMEPKENRGTDSTLDLSLGAPSKTQTLPEKQTLELVIDTLQRKDTYEIFAEPVDPEEVEDYYEIIEEPMDFGTMRAKLHEGMYTSLEQFEHDVFLISGNAMHFNSSGTIFFRQAHAIHKLAKKVFHVLRTDPENFESEFAGTRRRSCRRSHDETNELSCNSFLKIAEKSSTATDDLFLKNSNLSIYKSILGNPTKTQKACYGGSRDVTRFDSVEADRRSTYKPHFDLNDQKHSKSLILLNQHEHGYCKSLMHFVKDLGPTAQMVAKRKLHGLFGLNDRKQDYSVIGIMKTGSIDQDSSVSITQVSRKPNGTDRDETSTNGMMVMGSSHCGAPASSTRGMLFNKTSLKNITTTLMPHGPRFTFDIGFLKSKMNTNVGGEFEIVTRGWRKDLSFTQQLHQEETSCHDLALQL